MERLTPSQDLVITKADLSEPNVFSGGSAQGWRGASESDQQRALPHRHLHPRRPRSGGGKTNLFWDLDEISLQGLFPCVLGHEAAAVVESVGDGVTSVQVLAFLFL